VIERMALVTGASSGIGQAIADRLLDEGWQVIGLSRSAISRLAEPSNRYQRQRGTAGFTGRATGAAGGDPCSRYDAGRAAWGAGSERQYTLMATARCRC
jgi:NAD(P)-dependent dehydrogenase (short-subunit alcohol dehydrogenase family)